MTAGLVVEALEAGFGAQPVLRELDLSIAPGEVLALVGANGAGKSTLLACLTGLHRARSGRARLHGEALLGRAPTAVFGLGVARTFQHAALAPDLDVLGNVTLGLPAGERRGGRSSVEPLLEALALRGARRRRAGGLPVALRQRVALARALASRPRLLLLDEPGAGLDDQTKDRLGEILQAFLPKDAAVLLVEHDRGWARRVADRVVEMRDGRAGPEAQPAEPYGGATLAPPAAGAPRLTAKELTLAAGESVARLADPRGEAAGWLCGLAEDAPLTLGTERLDDASPWVRARAGLYYLPESGAALPDLMVQEDLRLSAGRAGGAGRADLAGRLAEDPLLAGRGRQTVRSLSGGERRWLGVLGALLRRPQVLLLDQPTAGLAPALRAEAWRRLHALRAEHGTALVFVTADPAEAAAHAHRTLTGPA